MQSNLSLALSSLIHAWVLWIPAIITTIVSVAFMAGAQWGYKVAAWQHVRKNPNFARCVRREKYILLGDNQQ